MLKFALLAFPLVMIGAKQDMGNAYWIIYGIYLFYWFIDFFVSNK